MDASRGLKLRAVIFLYPHCHKLITNIVLKKISWKLKRWRREWNRLLARCGPGVYVALNWPWPIQKPWQRARMDVYSLGGGIGDELMCASVFKEVKRLNPSCRITFRSRYPELFEGRDDIDELKTHVPDELDASRGIGYGHSIPPIRPIIRLLGEGVGIIGAPVMCTPPNLDPEQSSSFGGLKSDGRPLIVIQPETSSKWTSLKRWPQTRWNGLLDRLLEVADVVEVGVNPFMSTGSGKGAESFRSIAGKTDLKELARVVRQATVFVGLPSVGLHLANAFDIPAVILFGGYEHPAGLGYSNVSACYTDLPCAPCWIRGDGCPYKLKCMSEITEQQVFKLIMDAINHKL